MYQALTMAAVLPKNAEQAKSSQPRLVVQGEQALMWYVAESPSPQALIAVQLACALLQQHCVDDLVELVPAATSILIVFDLLKTDHASIAERIHKLWPLQLPQGQQLGRVVALPCYYDVEVAPDLARLANLHQLSITEFIQCHSSQRYQVNAIGFAPGFAYLGDVPAAIATPRLATPRARVPKGSVGIAGSQTAVYPANSPGGWNVIGNCPLVMFDLNRQPVMPLSVGDAVQFVAIDRAEFLRLGGEIGEWQPCVSSHE